MFVLINNILQCSTSLVGEKCSTASSVHKGLLMGSGLSKWTCNKSVTKQINVKNCSLTKC